MASRDKIVANQLKKYSVREDIEDILARLSFGESPSLHAPNWKVFTRKSEEMNAYTNNEFAAIYGNREFLVEGDYTSTETVQNDLECITKNIFNENWLSREIIRGDWSIMSIFAIPVATLAIGTYDILLNNANILKSIDEYVKRIDPSVIQGSFILLPILVLCEIITGAIGVLAGRNLLNSHYGSRLSKQAEQYLYGEDAEARLYDELNFERISSGELRKQEYLGQSLKQREQLLQRTAL